MTQPEPKACTACSHCIRFTGQYPSTLPPGCFDRFDGLYLCTLPPECFDLRDDNGDPADPVGEWVGMDCDRARRMGELCGPSGTLWEPASA